MHGHFLNFTIYAMNILVFNVWLHKKGKRKNEAKRSTPALLNPPQVTSAWAGLLIKVGSGATKMAAHLFVCTYVSEAAIRDQSIVSRYLEDKIFFGPP